jgi:tRNA(adenine34) deaminase
VPTAIPRIRASVVCRQGNQLLTVRAIDPVSGERFLFLPGGEIETDESPAAAAARETMEETGYAIRVHEPSLVLDYEFIWAGKPYDCRTHFFRASLIDPDAPAADVNDDAYLHGIEWVPVEKIDEVFAYHTVIRDAVRRLANSITAPSD